MSAKTASEFALLAAKTLSDGWGENEEMRVANELVPFFQQYAEQEGKEWDSIVRMKDADNMRLSSEVNALSRALAVALRYFRGPLE